MAHPEDPVAARLDADRKALLDLSLRNPLLNYRPRARGLEVVGESPEQVVRCLVREGRRMTFLAAPPRATAEAGREELREAPLADPAPDIDGGGRGKAERAPEGSAGPGVGRPGHEDFARGTPDEVEAGETPGSDDAPARASSEAPFSVEAVGAEAEAILPTPAAVADQTDHKLQSALAAELLHARLLSIYYAARASVEEQGVNTLFLALGMLRWTDPGHAGALRAPLILVPVELERSSARERFRLRHAGDDPEANLSLVAKLRADFAIDLPDAPEATDADVTRYLDGVAGAVAGQPGWEVDRGAIVLGFFSFGKFLMYRDLDPDAWPRNALPGEHRVVRALLRDGFPPAADEPAGLDSLPPAEQPLCVVDADATQASALRDVALGRDLVIQGPPGTGKSQTITNLIAGAVARGRTVLFVAEKLAALEVVKRRLDAVGLGDACLELHSHKTNKRAVLDELERTHRLGRPRVAPADDDLTMLAEGRDRLNAYAAAVHAPVGAGGVSPFEAVGGLLALRGHAGGPLPRPLDLPDWPSWTPFERKRRLALVAELQAGLAALGVPREHPFWGCRRTDWPPAETDRVRTLIAAASAATDRLRAASAAMAEALHADPPSDFAGCAALLRAARWAGRAARAAGVDVASPDWLARRADLHELLDAGSALAAVHAGYDALLLPSAWDEDMEQDRRTLNVDGRHWWRFVSRPYWRAKRRVEGLCRDVPPSTREGLVTIADAVLAARRHRETVRRHEPLAGRLFGPRWQGERSSWEGLARLTKWATTLHQDVRARRLPAGLLGALAARPDAAVLGPKVEALKSALVAFQGAQRVLSEALDFDDGGGPRAARPFDALDAALARWSERAGDLPALAGFNRLAARCRSEGLGGVVALAEVWPGAGRWLAAAVERHGYEAALGRAFAERPALAGFDAPGHEQAVRTFVAYDRLALRHGRARAALEHWQGLPRRGGGGGGQLGVLLREFEKKARHLPVRSLLGRAGNAVQAIKPVFLMSPLSVAAYLAPGVLGFDLVVFDEASQVRPVDALGAILRGRQAVVVGDSRQLPPTSFFDRLTGGDEAEPDDEVDPGESSEVESVLGLFVAAGAPERMLRWHYRSRHESLIAVANREFYGGNLVVFPSPDAARAEGGLVLRHLPGTAYDRGRTRTNPGEAEAVALAVMDHAREQLARPPADRLTLGVAAFGMAQAGAILDRLERLRAGSPECEPFFDPGGPEPFFVKNLESVQGDERDVIYISVGYGRDAAGGLAMGFGPLNAEGGERRLNVLITRARVRCEVFTNLTAEDIDVGRTRSRGVRALRTFLAYARIGRFEPSDDAPTAPSVEAAGPAFPRAVKAALGELGLSVRSAPGEPGFAPELAVADPDRPGRDVLGILTEGPAEPAGLPARDRERLRPQVLERLGWSLHRVYSPDWARDPDAAARRAVEAFDSARARPPALADPPAPAADHGSGPIAREEPSETGPVAKGPAAEPYRLAEVDGALDLASASRASVARRLAEVVRVEGPVHRDEAARRVAEGAGAKRLGPRAQAAIDEARAWAVARGEIAQRGDFLWPVGLERPPVRDRSALPAPSRKPDLVAPEEFAAAAESVVADALGMPADAVPSAACRLLGFPRITDEIRARVEAAVALLLEQNRLARRGEHLVAVEPGEGVGVEG